MFSTHTSNPRTKTGKSHAECRSEGFNTVTVTDEDLDEEFCSQAAVEQDAKKMLQLMTEITRLLAEKQDRLENSSRMEDRR
jgi:hypothetical protein